MAHFAKVVDGVVTDIIVVDNADCGGGEFPQSEPVGRAHIAALAVLDSRLEGEWFQASYNTRDGLHYGPDYLRVYNPESGEFLEPNGPGTVEGAFRLNFPIQGFLFVADAGEYGEFRPPLESE